MNTLLVPFLLIASNVAFVTESWPIVKRDNKLTFERDAVEKLHFRDLLLPSFSTSEENGGNLHNFEQEHLILRRKVGRLLLRKILQQGDILSEAKKERLDRLVANDQLTCDLCQVAVKTIQVLLNSNGGEDIISSVAVEVCLAAKIEDRRVCELAVEEFKDEVFYVLFNLKPGELCYWLLNDKCPKPVGFLPAWNITLPDVPRPPPRAPAEPEQDKPTSRFLFFTDMHIDKEYQAGASAVCGEPLCCRDNDVIPSNPADGAGKWGDYRNCDMPTWTVEGMMKNLSQYQFDFIMFTGDIPAHNVWNQSSLDQIDKIQSWTKLFTTYFPGTPVYAAVGNHESAPVNSYPPSSIYHEKGADIGWLYSTLYDSWSHWLPTKDMQTVTLGGFYTTLIRSGLRVVSLNTNYCSDDSWWLLVGDNSVDPEGQLQWFANVMQQAETNKEKVFIISHRPTLGCMESWSWNYYNIVNRYQNVIVAQLFGHAHTDELNLYYDIDDPTRVASVALIGPGFTTYSYLNAGYRIYTMDGDYDGTTNALLDAESYYLNITEANISNDANWVLEYTASKDYGMKNLSPAEWQKLVEKFEQDDELFQKYHRYISKSEDTSLCDSNCKHSTICDIKKFRPGDSNTC